MADEPDLIAACDACGEQMPGEAESVCRSCQRKLPPSLYKALGDPFQYALRLRTGEVWCFSEAEIHGDYVTLSLDDFQEDGPPRRRVFPFARGVDVRIGDIVWCADAPNGS
jgi:hypothetical protein